MSTNTLIAIIVVVMFSVPSIGLLTDKSDHEKRMELLEEIEYRSKIETDINHGIEIEKARIKLDSLHMVQDSLLNLK